jgi:hypothetical protein
MYRKGHKETAFYYFKETIQRKELLEWIQHSAPDLLKEYQTQEQNKIS